MALRGCRVVVRRCSHLQRVLDGDEVPKNTPKALPSQSLYFEEDRRRGLFGREGLLEPSDFARLAQRAEEKVKRVRDEIVALGENAHPMSTERAGSILEQLDLMSELLCGVADSSQLASQVHPDQSWSAAASDAHLYLQRLISELNSDPRLLHSTQAIADAPEVLKTLSEEQLYTLDSLLTQFRSQGLHQDQESRQRVIHAQSQIHQLISDGERLLYGGTEVSEAQRLDLLHSIVQKRQELAKMQEFRSYGDMTMHERALFKEPGAAIDFLDGLDARLDELPAINTKPLSIRDNFNPFVDHLDDVSCSLAPLIAMFTEISSF